MVQCLKCGTQAQGKFCPNCGSPLDYTAAAIMSPVLPPQQAWPVPAPPRQSIWQGVTALVLGLLICLAIVVGVGGNTADPDFANILLGGKGSTVVGAILVVPFGLWSLLKNRTGGKLMGGIGVALIAVTLLYLISF
jgi:hypothetical protein